MRTLPPVAAPLDLRGLVSALAGVVVPRRDATLIEGQFRDLLGVEHAFFFSSGRAALTVLLEVLSKMGEGRGVAIPAYTCYSVPAAIIRAGLEPVLVDVDPSTLDFDHASLRRTLGQQGLLCVLPTHLFGVVVDVEAVRSMCGAGVFVVEDAAQALGVPAPGARPVGSRGDAGLFSFARGKHLTCGRGGLLAVREPALAQAIGAAQVKMGQAGAVEALGLWMNLFATALLVEPRAYWIPSSLPFLGLGESVYSTDFHVRRLSGVGIGALRSWRQRLESSNRARAMVVDALRRELGSHCGTSRGPLLRYPVLTPSAASKSHFVDEGIRQGLGVSPMYPYAVHQIPALRSRFAGQAFPGAETLAARLATVPTHAFVRSPDVQRIGHAYRAAVSRCGQVATGQAHAEC